MATTGEEEVEYESDPEEAKWSLAMRKREAASDDEEDEREEAKNTEARVNWRAVIHSDESDDHGGGADYDDDEEELDLDDDDDEVYDEEDEEFDEEEVDEVRKGELQGNVERNREDVTEAGVVDGNRNVDEGVQINNNDNNPVGEEGEEEKKENEPFAVPTAGAFYMHDDRFRDNVGGSHRAEDLLEVDIELGAKIGIQIVVTLEEVGPKHLGKAIIRTMLLRLSGIPHERTSQANSSRAFIPETNADTASVPARKHIVESSLSSASPPFYPSESSNKDITLTQKKDMQAGSTSRKLHPSVTNENISVSQSNSLQGKNVLDSLSMAKLNIDDSSMSAYVKPLTNVQLGNTGQPSHSRVQGIGVAIPGQKAYQPAPHQNQVNKFSPPTQVNSVQRSSVQGRTLSSVQAAAQQLGQHPGIVGSQASSPPKKAMSGGSYESGEVESSEASKSKDALVSKGKGSAQGAGRGSFLYGGAQIMGATGSIAVNQGDQNFPAFLPVMQFGGQRPGGLGVPAVGMTFPGYVAQPQLGRGNSEMTWLPVLTGAAGALGATYCPPYIAVDGSYHARPSGQISLTGSSSRENVSNKTNNEWKPSQQTKLASDEFGQRQNNPNKQPRRQVENLMIFGNEL
ncbi:CASC3/Barentsz eIF4AIII binding, putative isoform 3 [Hibiscus syriacus]|uniref:CASC3/Barentsz eIF4AIII binding, putative isoform 3 n=1 Tax=Hibiscus syriacus TaxID=106335 RepID=A0A6A2ZC12_HIBSY|nr:CASC3/Barentsz eIF4AIII binding, putative isoform 3 [Hibiscus syriacus]